MDPIMRKKLKALSLVALALILLLQGCGGNKQSPGVDMSGKTLTVVSPFGQGDGYQAVYTQLLDDFQKDTGCAVTDTSERSSEKWKLDVLSSFDTGTEPDVLFFFAGAVVDELIKNGKVIDLNTIREYDASYAVNINLSVINTMKAADGLNYCVPVTGFWEGLYINKDLFDAHKIKIPTTMDEFMAVVEGFKAAGVIPIAVNLNTTPHYWYEYLLYNFTGPSNHNIAWDESKMRDSMLGTLEVIKELYEAGAFPPDIESVTDDACTALFVDGKAAMMLDGSWSAGSVKDMGNVQVVYMPAIEGGARKSTDIIGGFSMGYYITKKGWEENREAAVAFVKAMTGEKALTAFNANGSASPGPKSKTDDTSTFVKSTESFISSATAFVPALQDSYGKEAREYLFSMILDIAQGEEQAESVLDEFYILNK